MSCRESHEKKIKETALELHELMGADVPPFFNLRRWQGRLMAFAMRDENFKVKLFRFVDVLPALKEDSLITKMLNEYFSGLEDAPLILRQGIKRLSGKGILPHIAAGI